MYGYCVVMEQVCHTIGLKTFLFRLCEALELYKDC